MVIEAYLFEKGVPYFESRTYDTSKRTPPQPTQISKQASTNPEKDRDMAADDGQLGQAKEVDTGTPAPAAAWGSR